MWALEFERFFTFCSTIFGSKRQNVIAYSDWKLILSLDQGRPISQLRLLFFNLEAAIQVKPRMDLFQLAPADQTASFP